VVEEMLLVVVGLDIAVVVAVTIAIARRSE
jgi:hypothetical protein